VCKANDTPIRKPTYEQLRQQVEEAEGKLGMAAKELARYGIIVNRLHRQRDEFEAKYLAKKTEDLVLEPGNVEWVVNDNGELGVKIGRQYFFLYKGRSFVYREGDCTRKVRLVYKREFGECCHPPPKTEYSHDRGVRDENGSYDFGGRLDWYQMPLQEVADGQ